MHKRHIATAAMAAALAFGSPAAAQGGYTPTPENEQARRQFSEDRFGIFLHWGIYSLFAQGEWYLNYGPSRDEYAKAASAFYPHRFNARAWVKAIKDAGARYICFTTRHHDGFSMWDTKHSSYDIVEATPYGRDILRELADECQKQGIRLHLYYSLIDWTRDDYPWGRTGRTTGKDPAKADWPAYYRFMEDQLTELLTGYGPVGAIWFDGVWDRDEDPVPFDWQLGGLYSHIHSLQPACLVANNHHMDVVEGEDIQVFERDVPGENKAGYSEQAISRLPLETCQTMNGMWGYKIMDQDYKSADDLVRYLVSTAGRGANLLMNIGPQPNGELPAAALDRLKGMGGWLSQYGPTVYGTEAGDVPPQPWGVTTRKGDKLYVHVTDSAATEITLPLSRKVRAAKEYATGRKVKLSKARGSVTIPLPADRPAGPVYVLELDTK